MAPLRTTLAHCVIRRNGLENPLLRKPRQGLYEYEKYVKIVLMKQKCWKGNLEGSLCQK